MSATATMQPETNVTAATPALCFRNAAAAIDFYKQAFGAIEVMRFLMPDGRVGHAQIRIGNSYFHMGDEFPSYGVLSAETIGGSPIKVNLLVADVDAFVEKAVAAGAKVVQPVTNEFYGDRSGMIRDPFGYTWAVNTHVEDVSPEEVQRRMDTLFGGAPGGAAAPKASPTPPRGLRTLTPYLISREAEEVVAFVQQAFGAQGKIYGIGSGGGIHSEYRIGDSMLMIGGGPNMTSEACPGIIHLYVPDVDATYQRALAAGATSLDAPANRPYGDREGGVRDVGGNIWYIGTHLGAHYIPEGVPNIQPCLHPLRGEPVIQFLRRAFGGEEIGRFATPEGVIRHATVRIGTATIEMGEAHGPHQPRPATFMLYLPDVDAAYARALAAGGKSLWAPADQPYGDRVGGVTDAFGITWYIAWPVAGA